MVPLKLSKNNFFFPDNFSGKILMAIYMRFSELLINGKWSGELADEIIVGNTF